MPYGKVRVVGSNYSTFLYDKKPIAFLDSVEDSGQRAFADGNPYQFITPLGANHPVEVATSRVLTGGTLNLSIRELWNAPVWQQLSGLARAQNIVDIYEYLAKNPNYVSCSTIIKPPNGKPRGKVYQNCTIVEIGDGDTINLGTLSVTKNIVVAYTHSTVVHG